MPRPLEPNPFFLASAARTTSGSSSGNLLGSASDTLDILVNVTAVSGTSPTCALTVEWSNDGTTWAKGDPPDAFTSITAATTVVKSFGTKGRWFRLVWTLGGTTPSFTFDASASVSGPRAFA